MNQEPTALQVLLIISTVLYPVVGVLSVIISNEDEYNEVKQRHNIVMSVFWPFVAVYLIIKYTIIVIYTIIISIYLTILDIPFLKKIKEGIKERKMTPLYSSPGRVINNIKERTNNWTWGDGDGI